jgi:hypothetical protein
MASSKKERSYWPEGHTVKKAGRREEKEEVSRDLQESDSLKLKYKKTFAIYVEY